jgi:hypothetical protein
MMIIRGLSHGIVEDDELQRGAVTWWGGDARRVSLSSARVFLKREEK